MVLLPLFWINTTTPNGCTRPATGYRLPTYAFDDADLIGAIDRLPADEPLQTRMAANAAVIRSRNGTMRAADLIESIALSKQRRPHRTR
jgi:hypothetical protein